MELTKAEPESKSQISYPRLTKTSLALQELNITKPIQSEATHSLSINSLSPEETPIWSDLLHQMQAKFRELIRSTKKHQKFLKEKNLPLESGGIEYVIERTHSLLLYLKNLKVQNLSYIAARDAYRLVIQEYAFLRNSLSWCSASNDQSNCIMFFNPQENNDTSLNYDRYGSSQLRGVESNLLHSLGFKKNSTDLLLTSSGQAAYTVIESFLLGHVFLNNTTVATTPYIYFEALEQLKRLKHINVIQSPSWTIDSLIKLIMTTNANVMFLDPMANDENLNIVDLQALASAIGQYNWRDKWFVVDGTMISGGLNVFEIFNASNHPSILYYESGSKYLQLGLDMQMAGIVVASKQHIQLLSTCRRNTGGVMYQYAINRFPEYNRSIYLRRMTLLSNNAKSFTNIINSNDYLMGRLNLSYPSNWGQLGWHHGGGVVTISMKDKSLNDRSFLELFISNLLEHCRESNIPMTKGVSYGFSTTRVSATSMADDMPAYLRFSIGEEDATQIKILTGAVIRSLCDFLCTHDLTESLANKTGKL
jgi:threonine dehydratase